MANLKPKTMKQAMAMLKCEREAVVLITKQKLAEEDMAHNAQRLQRNAETSEKQTKEQFADLKQKLYDAEIELAKLRGFIDRVREDDAVRDPLVEVEDERGKRQVTKRFPSNRPEPVFFGVDYGRGDSSVYHTLQGREKSKHWTSY